MSSSARWARTVHLLACLSVLILAGMLFLRPRYPEVPTAAKPPLSRATEPEGANPRMNRPGAPTVPPSRPLSRPPALPEPGRRAGMAYVPEDYRSRLVEDRETYQVWELDPAELDWFVDNTEDMTQHDFQLVSNEGGGLRIACLRSGTFAALRGLRANDILLDLNGSPLERFSDISTLGIDPACNPRLGFRLTLERDGVTRVIDYRRSDR